MAFRIQHVRDDCEMSVSTLGSRSTVPASSNDGLVYLERAKIAYEKFRFEQENQGLPWENIKEAGESSGECEYSSSMGGFVYDEKLRNGDGIIRSRTLPPERSAPMLQKRSQSARHIMIDQGDLSTKARDRSIQIRRSVLKKRSELNHAERKHLQHKTGKNLSQVGSETISHKFSQNLCAMDFQDQDQGYYLDRSKMSQYRTPKEMHQLEVKRKPREEGVTEKIEQSQMTVGLSENMDNIVETSFRKVTFEKSYSWSEPVGRAYDTTNYKAAYTPLLSMDKREFRDSIDCVDKGNPFLSAALRKYEWKSIDSQKKTQTFKRVGRHKRETGIVVPKSTKRDEQRSLSKTAPQAIENIEDSGDAVVPGINFAFSIGEAVENVIEGSVRNITGGQSYEWNEREKKGAKAAAGAAAELKKEESERENVIEGRLVDDSMENSDLQMAKHDCMFAVGYGVHEALNVFV
mmetsp:Transcript_42054/g.82480  ORF Transcript_42054/g.82480 Transcript_42054/m.82480 type:complete len:462 (+) Transcript_42054:57-1442(+)